MALHHAKPGEIVELQPLGSKLNEANTSAIIKSRHFEAIHLVVRAGTEIPPHEVSGNITLHCLEGHVELGLDDTAIKLKANQWVYLDGGTPYSVKGVKDSSLLLTILFDAEA